MIVSAARTAAVSEAFIACVVAQPNVCMRKNVTSCSVTTDRVSGSAGPVEASECSTSTPRRLRGGHHRGLLGEQAAAALALVEREVDDPREVAPAVRAQRRAPRGGS